MNECNKLTINLLEYTFEREIPVIRDDPEVQCSRLIVYNFRLIHHCFRMSFTQIKSELLQLQDYPPRLLRESPQLQSEPLLPFEELMLLLGYTSLLHTKKILTLSYSRMGHNGIQDKLFWLKD